MSVLPMILLVVLVTAVVALLYVAGRMLMAPRPAIALAAPFDVARHIDHQNRPKAPWTYQDFVKLLATGLRKNGKKVDPFMPIEALDKMNEQLQGVGIRGSGSLI